MIRTKLFRHTFQLQHFLLIKENVSLINKHKLEKQSYREEEVFSRCIVDGGWFVVHGKFVCQSFLVHPNNNHTHILYNKVPEIYSTLVRSFGKSSNKMSEEKHLEILLAMEMKMPDFRINPKIYLPNDVVVLLRQNLINCR